MRYSDLASLVVHTRPYRESSAIVQFFTQEQGRIVGVMNGLRRGRNPVQVQPFSYGTLSCYGNSGMFTVTQFDVRGGFELAGDALSAGFYVLELITRALAERQVEPRLFAATNKVLADLAAGSLLAPVLRKFETELLSRLGYGIDYRHEAHSGKLIDAQSTYRYVVDHGFEKDLGGVEGPQSTSVDRSSIDTKSNPKRYLGEVLQAIAAGQLDDPIVLRAAKALNQQALAPLIGPRPLVSRSLLSGVRRRNHLSS